MTMEEAVSSYQRELEELDKNLAECKKRLSSALEQEMEIFNKKPFLLRVLIAAAGSGITQTSMKQEMESHMALMEACHEMDVEAAKVRFEFIIENLKR